MNHRVTLTKNGPYWQARWKDDDGFPRAKSLGNRSKVTRRTALALCLDIERQFVTDPTSKGVRRSPVLSAWWTRYESLRGHELDERTLSMHHKTVEYLNQFVGGDFRLDAMTEGRAVDFPAWLARQAGRAGKTLSPETVGLHVRNAKVLFAWAKRRKLIPANPFAEVTPPKSKGTKRFHFVTLDDLAKILDACPDDGWRAVFALCRRAGLRRGEALRLTWADVDFGAGTLAIRPEDDIETTKQRFRVVPMDPVLARFMVELHERAGKSPRVCPVGANNLDRSARDIIKRAGLPNYAKPFHALRKSLETEWLQRFPVMTVCKMMGHAPSVAAEFYHQIHDTEIKAVTGGTDPLAEAQAEIARLKAMLEQGVKA